MIDSPRLLVDVHRSSCTTHTWVLLIRVRLEAAYLLRSWMMVSQQKTCQNRLHPDAHRRHHWRIHPNHPLRRLYQLKSTQLSSSGTLQKSLVTLAGNEEAGVPSCPKRCISTESSSWYPWSGRLAMVTTNSKKTHAFPTLTLNDQPSKKCRCD